jgi:2-methylcitrate dehydratase PrpD
MPTLAQELARRINALSYDTLPAAAVQAAKVGILDFVGVTLAGCREDTTRIPAGVLMRGASGGSSLVFGDSARVNALDAALVNGIASHALDFDDCNNTVGGHPSAPLLPALIALADETGASGRDLIAAYVAGFETECKLGLGVHLYHYTHGWHPTATLGVFGAAAACAKLMKLPEDGIATALAIAASLASGIKANFGTMVKPLHVGHCSRNGLFAALLARDGFTANQGAFEHKQGFFNVFNGAGNYDAAKILPAWADPLDIVSPGIAVKQYPCCGSTHAPLDAALKLARESKPAPGDIERIQVWTHARRLEHTNRPDPQSDLDAKFSVQYCMARAFLDRTVAIEHFEGGAHREPAVRTLLSRVHAAPYTTAQFPAENHYGAEVRVALAGGKVVSGKVDQPFGRTSANPLPAALLKEKFDNCARRLLPAERVGALYSAIQGFDNLKAAREVTAIIAGDGGRARAAAA